jgi:hypothetical protein
MNDKLPNGIEGILFPNHSMHRNPPEKRLAEALLVGGVEMLKLSTSFYCDRPANRRGLLVSPCSLVAEGGLVIDKIPVLWAILRRLRIPYSGAADVDKGQPWAQASWLNSQYSMPLASPEYQHLDLPLVVCYFNALLEISV